MSDEQPQRPTTDDPTAWRAYWQAQGMPWRTEPENDEERQRFLAERRAVKPDIEKGIYPFRDENGSIKLARSDVEWLLAAHESHGAIGPVDWNDEKGKPRNERRSGLDLRGADLSTIDLRGCPLTGMLGGLTRAERIGMRPAQRASAGVHLEGANLSWAIVDHSALASARMDGADLFQTRIEGTTLNRAHLESANLYQAHLDGANLRYAFFDTVSSLSGVTLSAKAHGAARLYGVHWGGADLSEVDWAHVRVLGDEEDARQQAFRDGTKKDASRRLSEFETAVRANRQLATVLRSQGLNEHADRFAYRAQVLQRVVFWRQRHWGRWAFSGILDFIAGYGYLPLRSLLTYLLVVGAFALVYLALGGAHGQSLSWNEAVVVSLTAFHGRGFFATAFQPGDPQAAVAAIEAFFGLLIEITFIATFTQRFFAR